MPGWSTKSLSSTWLRVKGRKNRKKERGYNIVKYNKAIIKQSYTDKISPRSIYIYTHKKRNRGKINISCSQSPPPEFGLIRCLFRCSADAGTSRCLWSFNPLLLRLLGEISLSLLCLHSSRGSALDLDPPLRVGRLRASVPHPDRPGLKEQLLWGLWLTQAGGREGYGCGASLRRQRPA